VKTVAQTEADSRKIHREVCRLLAVRDDSAVRPRGSRPASWSRFIAYWLLRDAGREWKQIGAAFACHGIPRNHAGVIYGVRQVRVQRDIDPVFRHTTDQISNKLQKHIQKLCALRGKIKSKTTNAPAVNRRSNTPAVGCASVA
jgi:chromosomal replication initiation ATPase DnaA